MSGTKAGRKLGRKTGHRIALYRNMASSLIKYESIKTTQAKAKSLKSFIDSLISNAKKDDINARRKIRKDIQQKEILLKLFNELVPRYKNREGGFVKLVKLGNRMSDNAPICCIKLIS
ncbi:MAG: 50S ribosomal protein L17 [Elusimicrobiota bacterium]|jgi:large subunit ribosomal protein L17|nr:50S ribosomal protein L17 [Elusimicrobiota bacterium]